MIERVLFLFESLKRILRWVKVKKGLKAKDYTRGCGYYFPVGFYMINPIGRIEEYKLQNGRTGIYELIDYTTFRDPPDMIEKSYWHFLGLKDAKMVKDCSFFEFVHFYILLKS